MGQATLDNPNRVLLVYCLKDGSAAGQFRIDLEKGVSCNLELLQKRNELIVCHLNTSYAGGGCELSWTLAPEARGRGLGKRMVVLGTSMAPRPVRCVVHGPYERAGALLSRCVCESASQLNSPPFVSRRAEIRTENEASKRLAAAAGQLPRVSNAFLCHFEFCFDSIPLPGLLTTRRYVMQPRQTRWRVGDMGTPLWRGGVRGLAGCQLLAKAVIGARRSLRGPV